MYTNTFYKLEKKLKEKIIRKLVIKAHQKGFQYKFFIQLCNSDYTNFSLFLSEKKWIHKKKIEILEAYFGLQSQSKKKI